MSLHVCFLVCMCVSNFSSHWISRKWLTEKSSPYLCILHSVDVSLFLIFFVCAQIMQWHKKVSFRAKQAVLLLCTACIIQLGFLYYAEALCKSCKLKLCIKQVYRGRNSRCKRIQMCQASTPWSLPCPPWVSLAAFASPQGAVACPRVGATSFEDLAVFIAFIK